MKVAAKINAIFFACELLKQRVGTFGVVLYRNQRPQNFILLSYVLHIGSSIRYENVLNGNYFLICYIVKRILISFDCFSEYTLHTTCFMHGLSIYEVERMCHSAQFFHNLICKFSSFDK